MPEIIKNMSGNRSLILGGQVISHQGTQINLSGQDTCQGDSGGPLWTEVNGRAVLIGRFNRRRKRSEEKLFKIFTSFYSFRALNQRSGKQRQRLCTGSLPRHLHQGIVSWFRSHHNHPDGENQVKSHLSWIYAHIRTRVKYEVVRKGSDHSPVVVRSMQEARKKHILGRKIYFGASNALASCDS